MVRLLQAVGIGFEAWRGREHGGGVLVGVHRWQRRGNRSDGRNGRTAGQRDRRNLLREGLWNGEGDGLERRCRFGKRLRGCRRSGFRMRFGDGGLGNGLQFGGRSELACGEGLRTGLGCGGLDNRGLNGRIVKSRDGGLENLPGGCEELLHVAGIGFEAGRGGENGRGVFLAVHQRQRRGNRADGRYGCSVGQRGRRNLLLDCLWNGEGNGLERFGKRLRGCCRSGFRMHFGDGGMGNGLQFGGRSGVACGEGRFFRDRNGGGPENLPGGNAELFDVAGIGFEAGRGRKNGGGLFAAVHRRQRHGNRADGSNGGTVGQRGRRNLLRGGLWNGEGNGLKRRCRFGKRLRGGRRSGCRSHFKDSGLGNGLRFGDRSGLACGDGFLVGGRRGWREGGLLYGGGWGVPSGRN
ncbi:MAG: hypothetical protein IKQ55_08340 [Kiritimatiellae bacterium]|nr:hypothetical protein [Kiritimatiellia bacterium]